MDFNEQYFKEIYTKGETIDGDFNANDHANYLKAMFHLMGYHVSSLYDYGFGKGNLLKAVAKKLEVSRVGGCDVSSYAFDKLKNKKWSVGWNLEVSEIQDLKVPKSPYHLGLCNSVLQYLDANKVEAAVKTMAKSCRYVYLHVPTSEDYKILKSDLAFEDRYAKSRPNDFYYKIITKYFYFVSWGLVESKTFSKHKNSIFTDSLFRF